MRLFMAPEGFLKLFIILKTRAFGLVRQVVVDTLTMGLLVEAMS
jgi:hypothetical protein